MSRLFPALLALCLAGCYSMPKTADESYRECRIVRQPSGATLVVAPEIPFTVRGARGITSFQALIEPRQTRYFQMTSLGMHEEAGTYEAPRAKMEEYRKRGATLAVAGSGVTVNFPPAYVDGFLRRVDAEAAKR